MLRESAIAVRVSSTVVNTSWISPALMASEMCGRPSLTLLHRLDRNAGCRNGGGCLPLRGHDIEAQLYQILGNLDRTSLVTVLHPNETRRPLRQTRTGTQLALEHGFTEVAPTPMTSPVERISGPRTGQHPETRPTGKTASLTVK